MRPTPRSDQCAFDMPPGDSLGAIIMALTLARTLERYLAEAVEFLAAGERVFRNAPKPEAEMQWLGQARAFLQRMEGK